MIPPLKPLRVSIIGGGPGGLTLARILQETTSPSELHLTVYEREESQFARDWQSSSLDLHEKSGIRALKAAGLIEKFKQCARPDEIKICDKFGTVRYHGESSPQKSWKAGEIPGRLEVDRVDLRNMLVESINPQSIQWGQQLVSIQPIPSSPTNEYELTFSSGEKVISDLVVGADGGWSRIRPLLNPSAVPQYCGFSSFEMKITSADERYPELSQRAGNGSCLFVGDGKSFGTQRNSDRMLKIGGFMRTDENWIDQLKGLEEIALKEEIINQFKGYDDYVMEYARAADSDDIILRRLYALPLSCYNFSPHPSLTLLGDAAHLMSPFAGEGANLAMADAADLASQLSRFLSLRSKPNSRVTLLDVLGAYSKGVFKRALPAGRESARNLEFCHGDDAVEFMARIMAVVMGRSVIALIELLRWLIWRTIRNFFGKLSKW